MWIIYFRNLYKNCTEYVGDGKTFCDTFWRIWSRQETHSITEHCQRIYRSPQDAHRSTTVKILLCEIHQKCEFLLYSLFLHTLRLHYNRVLYPADSIITRSPRGSQLFFQYTMCENVSRLSRYTYNASCENRTPCVFTSQVWHQLIFPWAMSTGHSIYDAYIIRGHVSLKDIWTTIVYRIKLPRHVEKVIMMINNAGDVFQLCISTNRKRKLYNL